MKPPPFDYAAPDRLDEALELLADDADVKVLAGGQSLVPLLSMRLAFPDLLVDLRRIERLGGITDSGGHLSIGAMVRQREAETSDTVRSRCPLVVDALRHVAHPQIRTRGTIGGSVAHADPAGELPAVTVALDARVRAVGPSGERVVPAHELYRGILTTSLGDDEVVTEVEFPVAPANSGSACVEVARRNGDYAMCGAVAQVTTAGGVVAEARLAWFGVADTPVRASAAEAALSGKPAAEGPEIAAASALDDLSLTDDESLPTEYRRHLASVVASRAIERSLEATQ